MRFARIDSRESFAIGTPIFIARQADSHESLEFPIRANHPIRANRANRFARITRLSNKFFPGFNRVFSGFFFFLPEKNLVQFSPTPSMADPLWRSPINLWVLREASGIWNLLGFSAWVCPLILGKTPSLSFFSLVCFCFLGVFMPANFRKILVSVKFCPQFWGRKWVRQFYGRLEKCVLSAGTTHVHKIPRFRGGAFWVLGGGGLSADFIFMGARIFLKISLVFLSVFVKYRNNP